MTIRVLLFARLRDLVGREAVEVELPEGATLGDLWRRMQNEIPALQPFPHPPLMARNQEYVTEETVLKGNDEVAFLPPVSGGSGGGSVPNRSGAH